MSSARETLRQAVNDRRRARRDHGDPVNFEPELDDDISRWCDAIYPSAASVHLFVEATIFTRAELALIEDRHPRWLFHLPPIDGEGRSLLHSCAECSDAIEATLDREVAWPEFYPSNRLKVVPLIVPTIHEDDDRAPVSTRLQRERGWL